MMTTKSILLATVAAAGTLFGTASAQAGGHVSWSVGISAPVVGVAVGNGPVYAPAPVYESYPVYAPAPVYVQPAPVYYRPAPVVYGPPAYYYPRPVYYGARGYYYPRHHHHW